MLRGARAQTSLAFPLLSAPAMLKLSCHCRIWYAHIPGICPWHSVSSLSRGRISNPRRDARMAESRVARWRQRLRDEGRKAVTVWLSVEEEGRLKDLAVQWHTSPSEIMRHALAHFHPGHPPSLRDASETPPLQHRAIPDMPQIQTALEA